MYLDIYVAFHLTTSAATLLVASIALQHRKEPGAKPIFQMLIGISLWAFASAFELSAADLSAKIFWAKLQYLGITTSPVFYLLFALEYNRLNRFLNRKRIFLLFLIPVLTILLAWTNELHGWIWSDIQFNPRYEQILVFTHGIGFWLFSAGYGYFMVLMSTILIVWMAVRIPNAYRTQTIIIVIASIVPICGNLLYLLRLLPLPGLDLTPVTFAITGSVGALVILRFRLFDMVPVARELLLVTLPDGVMVLDAKNRMVDFNPAAQRLLGIQEDHVFGKPVVDVIPTWAEWEKRLAGPSPFDLKPSGNPGVYIEVHASLLTDENGSCRGRLIVLRDVTRRRSAQDELHSANDTLRGQLEEIQLLQAHLKEQAFRDPLTGLFNRRYLAETLDRELARAVRSHQPLTIAILDVDHFKQINDENGHGAGDEILRMLGDILHLHTRRSDIACRYGGDEFLVIMPGAPLESALHRAEQWKGFFREKTRSAHAAVAGTFSCGLANYPMHGTDAAVLLRAADLALYRAKQDGRDKVYSAE